MSAAGLREKFNSSDWFGLGVLVFSIAAYSVNYRFSFPPFEDAAMLMRYSQHIAQGFGIVWNIGEKPVDGATDFLFMLVLAALGKTGMTLEFAVRFIGIISHAATVILIYLAIRKFYHANRWLAFVPAFYLAVGPGLGYTEAGFGTSFFALAVCVTWCSAIKLSEENIPHITAFAFALLSLVTGLIRPEGVFLSVFMLISIIYVNGFKKSLIPFFYFISVYLILGGAYFFWRWNYFGDPLPNPFYVKGGGHFYWIGIKSSFVHTLMLLGPFSVAYILGLRSVTTERKTIFALIPVTGFIFLWTLMNNEMNYLMRYQYPVLVIALISFAPLVQNIPKEWELKFSSGINRRLRVVLFFITFFFLSSLAMYQYKIFGTKKYLADGIYDAAMMLRNYSDKHYTLATSESGILPLYSNWKAIDTYGLNDQWIAHHGGITEEYLDKNRPQIIMFRALFSPLGMQTSESKNKYWFDMTIKLKSYAEKKGYTLAASFGDTPYDTHNYYVRNDFQESAEIINKIRSLNYKWDTGRLAVNFALFRTLNN